MTATYRPEFEAALRTFARASAIMVAQGFEAPILVGGAAVEIFTASAVATGDLDVVTARQERFEAALRELGFVKPSGPGMSTRGWIHAELQLSFEVVSTELLDGLADRDRVVTLDFGADGMVRIISVEDMIADRMGQFASGTAPEMRKQARAMLVLHSDVDRAYLADRVIEETAGGYRIEDIETDRV